jgi:phosphotransferase system HPr (HPr) family protein
VRTVEILVNNPSGLHARPATLFSEAASRFTARITVENLDRGKPPADAKSILMLLTAGVSGGQRISLVAEGPDEAEAIETLTRLIEAGLGEAPATT